MKLCRFSLFIVLLLIFQFCKKSEPGKPMPISDKQTHIPPGYDPSVYHHKQELGKCSYRVIKDIIIDSSNKSNAFLIGNFYSLGSVAANGIIRFSSSTNSFSSYAVNLYSGADISSFYQASNGYHYIGGYFQHSQTLLNGTLAYKLPYSSQITFTVGVSDRVNVMKEIGSNFYAAGDFDYINTATCSPLIDINTSPVTKLGTYLGSVKINRLVEYNSQLWLCTNSSSYIQGYIMTLNAGTWDQLPGGGFNFYVQDLDVFNNTLYAAGQMNADRYSSTALNYVNQFNGTSWVKTGTNNLPAPCMDIEYYNNRLYACGLGYIYYLDTADNKWKSALDNSSVVVDYVTKIKFLNGRLYAVEYRNSAQNDATFIYLTK